MENARSGRGARNLNPNGTITGRDQQTITGGVSFGQGTTVKVGRDVIGTLHGYTHEQVIELVNALREGEEEPSYSGRPPYLGLEAYQEGDADLFFGREQLTGELVELLRSARFMCLAGPSGSGKSSLARAGLIPALRSGGVIPGSDKWSYSRLIPGDQPLESLAKAVSALALSNGMDFQAAGDRLRTNGQEDPSLLATLVDLLTQSSSDGRAVLLVDQFEQVFSPSCDTDQAAAFVAQLIHAAQLENGHLKTILTLRSDFLGHCSAYPPLRELINQGFQLVGAMSIEELARAITLPPLQVGVEVQPELVQQVIVDMQNEPGALPLMQFALRDVFEAQDPRQGDRIQLTQHGYLERGGVWGALQRHADSTLKSLTPDGQEIARQVFTHLIAISSDQAPTHRTATRAELKAICEDEESLRQVLDALVTARLLIAEGKLVGDDATNSTQVLYTLAHDRLIDTWPWLAQLVEANRQTIALTSQIESDAQAWKEDDEDPGYLYRGAKLEAARLQEENLSLSPSGIEFLEQSQQQQEIEQRQSLANRLKDSGWRGLGGGAIGFGLAFLLAFGSQIDEIVIIELIFGAIFMAASGAFGGLILALSVETLRSRSKKYTSYLNFALGGLAGSIAFSIPLMVYYLLLAAPFKFDQFIMVLLESSLWGFIAGLGVTASVRTSRPKWVTLAIVGITSGLALMVGEVIADGFTIPDRTQVLGETATSQGPSSWLIFVVGALVPLCIAGAMLYRRDVPKDLS